jgi:hypothetical protein
MLFFIMAINTCMCLLIATVQSLFIPDIQFNSEWQLQILLSTTIQYISRFKYILYLLIYGYKSASPKTRYQTCAGDAHSYAPHKFKV